MPPLRPILSAFQHTPWVASTPVDDSSVAAIVPRQVQVAIVGDGPFASRELRPLTPAARELLYGPHRDRAEQAIRGMISTLDAQVGASTLRGFSLATDQAGFATNLLMSTIEAGIFPDSVSSGDRRRFESDFTSLGRTVQVARAQNTGWLDFGPKPSSQLRSIIELGTRASRADAEEFGLVAAHELQHSVTPHNPTTIADRHVWVEEGIAETLAWWPGVVRGMLERMGAPVPLVDPDPYMAAPGTTASAEYRARHRAVQALLGLAGITPYDEAGTPSTAAHRRAMEVLQGGDLTGAARRMAAAIGAHRRLPRDEVDAVASLIDGMSGTPGEVVALEQMLDRRN